MFLRIQVVDYRKKHHTANEKDQCHDQSVYDVPNRFLQVYGKNVKLLDFAFYTVLKNRTFLYLLSIAKIFLKETKGVEASRRKPAATRQSPPPNDWRPPMKTG